MIGDPSGKNETRPSLSREQILQNAKTYQDQVFKILDANRTEFCSIPSGRRAGGGGPDPAGLDLDRCADARTRRLRQRYAARQPIAVHEFLYPLMQGYDSSR